MNIIGCQFIPGYPDCIYLDTEENEWSTKGCVVRIIYYKSWEVETNFMLKEIQFMINILQLHYTFVSHQFL